MTDIELLELAAKACGFEQDYQWKVRFLPSAGGSVKRGNSWVKWNPLEDNGDVFRLAIKLEISICFRTGLVEVGNKDGTIWLTLPLRTGDNVEEVVKRMIVSVAAEIGKGMK